MLEQRCLAAIPKVVRHYGGLMSTEAVVYILIDAPDEARELVARCKRVLQVRRHVSEDAQGIVVRDGDMAELIERLGVMLRRKRGPGKKVAA